MNRLAIEIMRPASSLKASRPSGGMEAHNRPPDARAVLVRGSGGRDGVALKRRVLEKPLANVGDHHNYGPDSYATRNHGTVVM
jgi:hypothetical protein